jgi:hypothetical protein
MVNVIAATKVPPNTPHCSCSPTPSIPTRLEQLLEQLIQAMPKPGTVEASAVKSDTSKDIKAETKIVRASKLKFRKVNEVYVSNEVGIYTS